MFSKSIGLKCFSVTLLVIFAAGCEGPTYTPDAKAYATETSLMVKICSKFAEDTDVKRMHSGAVGTQLTRVISCANYNDECNLYNKCVQSAISYSASGTMSSEDRADLRQQVMDLRAAISEGKAKIQSTKK